MLNPFSWGLSISHHAPPSPALSPIAKILEGKAGCVDIAFFAATLVQFRWSRGCEGLGTRVTGIIQNNQFQTSYLLAAKFQVFESL